MVTYPLGLCDTDNCVGHNLSPVVGDFNKSQGSCYYVGDSVGEGARPKGNRARVKTSKLSLGAQCYSGIQGLLSVLGYREKS